MSPPARGAWIATEAADNRGYNPGRVVASREGGVDRKHRVDHVARHDQAMAGRLPRGGRGSQHLVTARISCSVTVASREGGVDRNDLSRATGGPPCKRRLPRGGRGSQQVYPLSESTVDAP